MTILDEFRRDEQRVLDRLCDGELSQDERRALLAALDDEPGAWRRCALAFLEAQSWRWQLSRLAAEPLVAQAAARPAPSAAKRGRLWGLCLAIAASLLVAFGLGTRFPTAADPNAVLVADRNATSTPTTPDPDNHDLNASGDEPNSADAIDAPTVDPASVAGNGSEENGWETLTLARPGDSDPDHEIQVRVVPSEDGDEATWLAGESSPLPARLLEQLEQAGWHVERQQRWLPIDLSDGRQLIVPVEEVDIRYPEVAKY